MDLFVAILKGIILTLISYMGFPVIKLIINRGKFTSYRAKKIALWNSVVVGAVFCVLTFVVNGTQVVWNAAPAVLYYFINLAILEQRKVKNNETFMQSIVKDGYMSLQEECDGIILEDELQIKCGSFDITSEQFKVLTIISKTPEKFCEYIVELKKVLEKGTYNEKLKIDKALDYVENLHLDDGQKKILIKMQFPHFDKYNKDIALYVNDREDISYDDTLFVLEELGFAVFSDGTVKW